MSLPRRSLSIFIIEDSKEDLEAILWALKKAHIDIPIHHCQDGDIALDLLNEYGSKQMLPALVLLDLNLPGMEGHEVLSALKKDQLLCQIPVVILTTSSNPKDIERSYKLGASGYIIKPVNLERFSDSIKTLGKYWFETVILPEQPNY